MDQIKTEKPRIKQRIQSIECFRLIASVLIAILHCDVPGQIGTLVNCLGRAAVPFFFVVSGYFLYRASEKAIRKRFWSVVKLTAAAHLLYLLWGGISSGIRDLGGLLEWMIDQLSSYTLMVMLLTNRSSVRSHLWYFNAIVLCYAAMWLYVRWSEKETPNYKPLYITGVCLYSLHVVLSSFATASGFDVPYYMYRNALLYGLPMFALGIFLREYQEKIIRVYNLTKIKLLALVIVGALLSLLQWKGTGKVELPVGTLLEVIALMLLFVMVPVVSGNSSFLAGIISTFGTLSTYIYISHMLWLDVYQRFLKDRFLLLGETAEAFAYPAVVVGLSLTTGIFCLGMKAVLKWCTGKIKTASGTHKS